MGRNVFEQSALGWSFDAQIVLETMSFSPDKDVSTSTIYTHVLNTHSKAVYSPLDGL